MWSSILFSPSKSSHPADISDTLAFKGLISLSHLTDEKAEARLANDGVSIYWYMIPFTYWPD